MITLAERLTMIEQSLRVLAQALPLLVPSNISSQRCPLCKRIPAEEGHAPECPSQELPLIAGILKENRIPGPGEPFCEMCEDVMLGYAITSIGRQKKLISNPCVRCDQPTPWHVIWIEVFDEYREIAEDKEGDRSYRGIGIEATITKVKEK